MCATVMMRTAIAATQRMTPGRRTIHRAISNLPQRSERRAQLYRE